MMRYDVVIVGGAVIGSAIAYRLIEAAPDLNVAVFERDPSYQRSSTLLSDGNVRIQFNLPENILMSQYALEVLESFGERFAVGGWKPEPAVRKQGNLFLVDAEGEQWAREGLAIQRSLGCDVEWLDADEVGARFPAYRGTGYVGGTLGTSDGSVDPTAVLEGYRRKALEAGVAYRPAEVAALLASGGKARGVLLSDGTEVTAAVVVNAAGAWCAGLAATAGIDLPVTPVMRSVFVVETGLRGELPSVFLPSGLYALPEQQGRFLVGWSRPEDPVGFDFTFRRGRFDEVVWPELASALPAFEALHLDGGWCGLYEVNTLDGNAILGEWPELPGFYLANGFSGHGFQQCHAVGRHLAELILGREPSLDLSRFGPARIVAGEAYPENPNRII